jgi:hypothetical protein
LRRIIAQMSAAEQSGGVERPGAGMLLVRRLFLAGLGVTYLCAFVSLAVQVRGLIGQDGLAPATELLARAAGGRTAVERFAVLPNLFWLGASDGVLLGAAWVGALAGIALVFGSWPRLALLLAWTLYLSLTTAGGVFLAFQWDSLLLETGLLALFVAPGGIRPGARWRVAPPRAGVWLLRFLLLRLMFASGLTKLTWDDPTWWSLTALDYHFWTQPLPAWTSWYADQSPVAVRRAAEAIMFAIELVLPWLVFGPRRLRLLAACGFALLQVGIALTGNYGFFNLLTLVLCLSLCDDRALRQLVPGPLRRRLAAREPVAAPSRRSIAVVRGMAAAMLALFATLVTIPNLAPGIELPERLDPVLRLCHASRSVSGYGLFRTMTTSRPELEIEGSHDGGEWKVYRFPHKPGPLDARPRFVGFHMPRLDWQMWFEGLRFPHRDVVGPSAWFVRFLERLLQGSAAVRGLLAEDPFGDEPPRFVRVRCHAYTFAPPDEREHGIWWEREPLGPYTPVLTLRDGRLGRAF